MPPGISRQSLINWSLAHFGSCFAKQFTQNQMFGFFTVFLFSNAFWFFLKTCLRVRKSNFEIIFALSLRSLSISRQGLVNLSLIDFGACSAKQCTQVQNYDIFGVFLWLVVLFRLCIKIIFELGRVLRNNFCSFSNGSWNQPRKFGKLMYSRFWGVLWQTVRPESNLRLFQSFSLFDSALWLFLKTCLRIR